MSMRLLSVGIGNDKLNVAMIANYAFLELFETNFERLDVAKLHICSFRSTADQEAIQNPKKDLVGSVVMNFHQIPFVFGKFSTLLCRGK